MPNYEYKVVPAPAKGKKARGVKGAEARFAFALETVMNEMAAEGWQYQRAETLPNEERAGLTGSQTTFRNMLVFRRPRQDDIAAFEPRLLEQQAVDAAEAEADPEPPEAEETAPATEKTETPETGDQTRRGLPAALRRRAKDLDTTAPEPDKPAPGDDSGIAAQ